MFFQNSSPSRKLTFDSIQISPIDSCLSFLLLGVATFTTFMQILQLFELNSQGLSQHSQQYHMVSMVSSHSWHLCLPPMLYLTISDPRVLDMNTIFQEEPTFMEKSRVPHSLFFVIYFPLQSPTSKSPL